MIRLQRLNGYEVIVNAELIELLESLPDTTLTLATGTKIIVKDSVQTVIDKIMEYRKALAVEQTPALKKILASYEKKI
jgi:flagellar protein FlbD